VSSLGVRDDFRTPYPRVVSTVLGGDADIVSNMG
jgi:hypothetical protein